MRVFDIRRFDGSTLDALLKWVKEDLTTVIREFFTTIRALDFSNNFKSFQYTGTIAAGATIAIPNGLTTIPTQRLIVRAIPLAVGTVIVDDSQTAWTKNSVYLRNIGTAGVKITVVFLE